MLYGLDLSLTATGFASAAPGTSPAVETIKLKNLADEARLAAITDAVLQRMKAPKLVAIEGLALGSRTGLSAERCALHYMVRVALYESKVPFLIVAPNSLKKFATGKGNAEKNVIIREVYRRWGIEAADDNQADAAVLAQIARAWAGERMDLTVPQTEVLKSLAKNNKPLGEAVL